MFLLRGEKCMSSNEFDMSPASCPPELYAYRQKDMPIGDIGGGLGVWLQDSERCWSGRGGVMKKRWPEFNWRRRKEERYFVCFILNLSQTHPSVSFEWRPHMVLIFIQYLTHLLLNGPTEGKGKEKPLPFVFSLTNFLVLRCHGAFHTVVDARLHKQ